jgi:glutamate dehydrogenase/leucine dehydrogenase
VAITASGLYGLSLEKALIDTLGESWEAEDNKVLMVTDSYTHDYTVHDFRDDITNEVTGTGYTAGGIALTGTEITLASGLLTFDATDSAWASSTIANAMAAVGYFNVGSAATDPLWFLSDFVTAVSTTNGTLTVQWAAGGVATIDFTP